MAHGCAGGHVHRTVLRTCGEKTAAYGAWHSEEGCLRLSEPAGQLAL